MRINAADLLVYVLADSGIEIVAGVPGASVFTFGEAVDRMGLRKLLVRHEATAAFAADAYYRVSGKLMAVMLHGMPGATNALAGIANAFVESSAMVVILGDTARQPSGRGAYQELSRAIDADTSQLMRHVSKRVWIAHEPAQLVDQTIRATRLARSGRAGPTVLNVPQDLWSKEIEGEGRPLIQGYAEHIQYPDPGSIEEAGRLLGDAERPLILAGGGVNFSGGRKALRELAEQIQAPVATTVTGKGSIPEDHPLALGVIGWFGTTPANRAGREADVILCVGTRLAEDSTSSWQRGVSFSHQAKLIHVDVDIEQIANVYPVEIGILSDARTALEALRSVSGEVGNHREWLKNISESQVAWKAVSDEASLGHPSGPMGVGPIVRVLRDATRGSPINLMSDVGKHQFWLAQQFQAAEDDIILSTMGGGVMGFGPAGAIGAALGRPNSKTIAWVGDGGMSMTPYVLPTAAEYQLPITFVVIDDASYSTISLYQQRTFGRTFFSEFDGSGSNPNYRLDLAAVAEACGVPSRRVTSYDQVAHAITWAIEEPGPTLLDMIVDPTSNIPSGGGSKLLDYNEAMIYPWNR